MTDWISENFLSEVTGLFLPWVVFLAILIIFIKFFSWAKNRKTGAVIFGLLVQMLMPDPYVEKTITVVQEEKKLTKAAQNDSDDDAPKSKFKLS